MTSLETSAPPSGPASHRALRLAVGAAAVVVLMIGTEQFADIIGPFFLALNLMIVVWPVQRYLSRHLPKALAAVLAGLLAVTLLGLLMWAIGWALSVFVAEIPQYSSQFTDLYDKVLNLLGQYGVTSSQIITQLKSISPGSVVSFVGSLLSNVGSVVTLFVVVGSVLLFMIVDSIGFEERMERIGTKHSPVMLLALQSFAQGVRSYWVTSTVFGLIVSLLTWAGLAWYGIPLAVVWAVLAFVTNYIPNVGFVIGLVPAAVMGFLAKGPWGAVFVIALYSVLNFVIQNMIQPKVTGDAVGLTATVSLMSLLVWAIVLGPLGALLALPATLFVKALVVDADPDARWVNALIASDPRTSDEEPAFKTAKPSKKKAAAADAPSDASTVTETPRRAAGEVPVRPSVDTEDLVAVPRRSAVEIDDPREDEPARAVVEPTGVASSEEPEVGESQDTSTTVEETVAQDAVSETEPTDDVPKRARTEEAVHEVTAPVENWPVFQKSATPHWPGPGGHGED